MSDIVLDTPEEIDMWLMLSRRHQVQMHLKGYKVKGITTALKREFGDQGSRVKDYVVPIESAIAMAGGEADYNLVNVHVMLNRGGVFHDRGIFSNMSEVEANATLVQWYMKGLLEIVYTLDEPREPNGQMYVPE